MYWLEVSVLTDGEGAEAVAEALRPYAYNEGVVLEQLGLDTDPAPDALESAVTVKIYVPEEEDTAALRRRLEEVVYHLGRLYPLPPPMFRRLEETDWANTWKTHYHPFRIGQRIWIQPSWVELETAVAAEAAADSRQPDDVVLVLDPGMAFGTGLHPTTQMCLQAVEKYARPGMTVLDVGTGSGILAIAAAKLGAGSLLAIDNDELAVKAAAANAAKNGVVEDIVVKQATLIDVPVAAYNLVLVNILAPVIVSLFSEANLLDYVAAQGKLVLSGIIDVQGEMIETAVGAAGGVIVDKIASGDWLAYVVEKAANPINKKAPPDQ